MSDESYYFDAFISYRHNERDKKLVDTIQKLTEKYRSPCDGTYIKKGERIRRIFTDRSELPMSTDLGASITQALIQSRFLLVIASPEYMESRWCMKELRTFLDFNNNSTDRILFIQADGSPSCVTDILSAAGICVEAESFKEPLYINVRAKTVRNSIKIMKKEYLRLAAVLIGCGYDSLYQRHKRAKKRKIIAAAVIALLAAAIIGTVFAIQAHQRKQEADYHDMDVSISTVNSLLQAEDLVEALMEMQTLYDRYGQNSKYAGYLAEQLESAVLRASYVPAFSAFANESLPFENTDISVSNDGKYVIIADMTSTRVEGSMHLILCDAYLRKISEHTLTVEEWKDNLVLSTVRDSLYIDHHETDNTFAVEYPLMKMLGNEETPGRKLTFTADGQLLDNQELPLGGTDPTSQKLQEMYDSFKSLYPFDQPVCVGSKCLYTVLTQGDSLFDPFGEKGEPYWLVVYSTDGSMDFNGSLERTSDMHVLDTLSITPDDRFLLVKETRGVYNDVLSVCDTEERWKGVRIDLGSHTINHMLYRFDEEKQEARFLFNLHIADESDMSLIAECRVASGQLLGCEMYESKYAYDCLLSELGYVYIQTDTEIIAIATGNICLPELITGVGEKAECRTDIAENDMIEDTEAFSPNSTGSIQSITAGNLTFTPDITRMHHTTPAAYVGVDTGIGIYNSAGEEIVSLFSTDFLHAYFNRQDGVFGLMDYTSPENSELFRLYDFYSLMELLH